VGKKRNLWGPHTTTGKWGHNYSIKKMARGEEELQSSFLSRTRPPDHRVDGRGRLVRKWTTTENKGTFQGGQGTAGERGGGLGTEKRRLLKGRTV